MRKTSIPAAACSCHAVLQPGYFGRDDLLPHPASRSRHWRNRRHGDHRSRHDPARNGDFEGASRYRARHRVPASGSAHRHYFYIDEKPGATTLALCGSSLKLENRFGAALQAGVDIPIDDRGLGISLGGHGIVIEDAGLAARGQIDNAFVLGPGELAADAFDLQPQHIGDLLTRKRQGQCALRPVEVDPTTRLGQPLGCGVAIDPQETCPMYRLSPRPAKII